MGPLICHIRLDILEHENIPWLKMLFALRHVILKSDRCNILDFH